MLPQEQNSFRQVCDKPCSHAICVAEWSPLRDLIAVITANGDVRLHRMHWQKVWVYSSKNKKAECLAWTPNGKTITVGFNNGLIELIEIEKCTVVHHVQCDGIITCLKWNKQTFRELVFYEESISNYLPVFLKEETIASMKNIDLISHNNELVILSVGTSKGNVYLFVDGVFLIVELCVKNFNESNISFKVLQVNCDASKGNIQVVCKGLQNQKYYYQSFHSNLLSAKNQEILFLSKKYLKCAILFSKMSKCFQQMTDTSEDVYIKITSKIKSLEKLIEPSGSTIAYEFTNAYTTGFTSPELQTFFAQVLTTKVLSQLAQSVDLSYNSLQNDIKNEFTLYLQHFVFHITELEGISSWFEKFGILGLSKELCVKLKRYLIEINIKLSQLKSLIVNDVKYFHVFFTWLKGFIDESNNETNLSSKCQSLNDKDYDIMLEFLESRLLKNDNDNCYNFEQVNQFFKNETSAKFVSSQNEFLKFLDENEAIKNSPLIFLPNENISFPNLIECFDKELKAIFSNISNTLTEAVNSTSLLCLYTHVDTHSDQCVGHFEFSPSHEHKYLKIIPCCCDSANMYIMKEDSGSKFKLFCLSIDDKSSNLDESSNIFTTLKNAKFYNDDIITLVFDQEDQNLKSTISYIAQLPISNVLQLSITSEGHSCNETDGILEKEDIPLNYVQEQISEIRQIEAFSSKFVSVNGYSRQVSIIVSMTGRRVRVFDMTADDDAEETRDESRLEQSKSESMIDINEELSVSLKD